MSKPPASHKRRSRELPSNLRPLFPAKLQTAADAPAAAPRPRAAKEHDELAALLAAVKRRNLPPAARRLRLALLSAHEP